MELQGWFSHALVIAAAAGFIVYIVLKKRWDENYRVNSILNAEIPANVRKEVKMENPNWTVGMVWDAEVGFKEYMSLFVISSSKLAMPSKGIDEVWHAFLKFPEEYEAFCKKHIGRVIKHEPMKHEHVNRKLDENSKFDISVLNTKKAIGKALKRGYPLSISNHVPLIFLYDTWHNVPDGWHYNRLLFESIASQVFKTSKTGGGGSVTTSSGYETWVEGNVGAGIGSSCNSCGNDGGGGGCGGD